MTTATIIGRHLRRRTIANGATARPTGKDQLERWAHKERWLFAPFSPQETPHNIAFCFSPQPFERIGASRNHSSAENAAKVLATRSSRQNFHRDNWPLSVSAFSRKLGSCDLT
jgi:hypothetical protein